ncbi:hypothetical protein Tco_0261643 [Tanacetum coccineum]
MEPDVPVINNVDEDECFDPGGGEINVEVDNSFTFVIRTFLLYLTYPEVSPLLSSTENEDTIFDPDISTQSQDSGNALETLFVDIELLATLNLDFSTIEVAPIVFDLAAIEVLNKALFTLEFLDKA